MKINLQDVAKVTSGVVVGVIGGLGVSKIVKDYNEKRERILQQTRELAELEAERVARGFKTFGELRSWKANNQKDEEC